MTTIGRLTAYWRKPEAGRPLALDLSSEAVRLMERTAAGGWKVLGAAPLDAGFSTGIDGLRVEAMVRARSRGPASVDLWLPAEQVLVSRHLLPRGSRGREEARRRVAAESGWRASEVAIAVAPGAPGQPTTVLATTVQTVAEAREYAARWGFTPARVSTAVAAERFGPQGPAFAPPPGRAAQLLSDVPRPVFAAAAAAVLCVALWNAGGALLHEDAPPTAFVTAPELAAAPVDLAAPTLWRGSPTQVSRGIQPLGRAHATPRDGSALPGLAENPGTPLAGLAPELALPQPGTPMRVGPAPVLPHRDRPGRIAPAGGAAGPALLATIDNPGPPPDEARPAVEAQAAPELMAGGIVLVPDGDLQGASDEAPDMEVQLAATSMAPRSMPAAPPPRPRAEPQAAAAEEQPVAEAPTATGTPAVTPAPRPRTEAEAEAEAEVPETTSTFAAADAPRPSAKPGPKAKRFQTASSAHRAFGGTAVSAKVRSAAIQHGLKMDSTSLIGVLDARAGRQALLRTATGGFLKVGRGDLVEGWRVNAINRDAVRLTRGSESRTLLLVTR